MDILVLNKKTETGKCTKAKKKGPAFGDATECRFADVEKNIRETYPGAVVLDITSTSEDEEYRKLSPFYPHGNIPVPGMKGCCATCVEAIWQGLKIFENCGIDLSSFKNATGRNIKRTTRVYGRVLGHKYEDRILGYLEARGRIYLPAYKYVLDNKVGHTIEHIRQIAKTKPVILLDYNTNDEFRDVSKPLSHAALVKAYINGAFPEYSDGLRMLTCEEMEEKRERDKKEKESFLKAAAANPVQGEFSFWPENT